MSNESRPDPATVQIWSTRPPTEPNTDRSQNGVGFLRHSASGSGHTERLQLDRSPAGVVR